MTPQTPQFHRAGLIAAALLVAAAPLAAQQTSRVSTSTTGTQGDRASNRPDLSADGLFLAFETNSTTFDALDTNFVQDVYYRDLTTGVTERVSIGPLGVQGNGESKRSVISGDGNRIAFISLAGNFDPLDFNLTYDIFIRDRALGTTTLASRALTGLTGNAISTRPAISADGDWVVYRSSASDMVAADTNLADDILLYHVPTGALERVSVDSLGAQANGGSDRPSISGDGNVIAFWSDASNLVAGDLNLQRDIFVRDRAAGTTVRISVSSTGVEANGPSSRPSVSDDGRYVAFHSDASNLVAGDTNFAADVFVHDLLTGITEVISKDSAGVLSNALSSVPSISGDGRYVSYRSLASNLVPGDNNNSEDVFLHDRQTAITTILSRSTQNNPGNGHSTRPSISADGSRTMFQSLATNMIALDTNLEEDCFLHEGFGFEGPPNTDSIGLSGPASALVGTTVSLTWTGAPPDSPYWLIYGFSASGMVVFGHQFDVGPTYTILDTGFSDGLGEGSFTSVPLPPAAAGLTVYLELAAQAGNGALLDSNVLPLLIL